MQINDLQHLMAQHPEVDVLCREIGKKCGKHFLLPNLYASARSLIISALFKKLQTQQANTLLITLDNADDAQYMCADLRTLVDARNVFYFPCSHRKRQRVDEALTVQRTEVLSALLDNASESTKAESKGKIIVSYPDALADCVPNPKALEANKISLCVGEEIAISSLVEMLLKLHEPGQFAIRGGIVDVYSYSHDMPMRIDFFGSEIDSIREFELETQLSKNKVDNVDIVADSTEEDSSSSILAYLPPKTVWISPDFDLIKFKLQSAITSFDTADLIDAIANATTLELNQKSSFATHDQVAFDTFPQPTFNKNFDLLIDDLQQRTKDGYKIYILADQVKQTDRLKAIFDDKESGIQFMAVDHALHEGFIDHCAKICCYTDHQIFERYHRVTLRSENARRGKAIITLKEINQLQVGDYVVHADHGIGQFAGLVTTNFHGRPQETIKLVYKGGDTVFVSIHNLHRISKYKGREGSEPTISRLGSGAWERMKERTKDKVKDIARDLIQLYATRKQQKGFAYTPDSYLQHELEASFLYEDTPD